jgi:hypothetical protein
VGMGIELLKGINYSDMMMMMTINNNNNQL